MREFGLCCASAQSLLRLRATRMPVAIAPSKGIEYANRSPAADIAWRVLKVRHLPAESAGTLRAPGENEFS
jgi:hypothetical protein